MDIELALEAQRGLLLTKIGIINRYFLDEFKPTGNQIEVTSAMLRCGNSTLIK